MSSVQSAQSLLDLDHLTPHTNLAHEKIAGTKSKYYISKYLKKIMVKSYSEEFFCVPVA